MPREHPTRREWHAESRCGERTVTEGEWTATVDAEQLVAALPSESSNRKLRLFGVGCCRRIWPMLKDSRSRQAIDVVERYADGGATDGELEEAGAGAEASFRDLRQETTAAGSEWDREPVVLASSAVWTATVTPTELAEDAYSLGEHMIGVAAQASAASDSYSDESLAQSSLLRDIFGNPFRPVAFDAAWRTSTAVALAAQMYESREFGAMPILADALQDAGCDNPDILNHCRGEGPHVRGCWVVDLVLGKE